MDRKEIGKKGELMKMEKEEMTKERKREERNRNRKRGMEKKYSKLV